MSPEERGGVVVVCVCGAAACPKSRFSFLLVQAGPPDVVALHAPYLPVRLEQVPVSLHLQVVDPARLHAESGGALRGPGPQAADGAALRGPETGPHTAGLGERGAGGRGHQATNDIGGAPILPSDNVAHASGHTWIAKRSETHTQTCTNIGMNTSHRHTALMLTKSFGIFYSNMPS